MVGRRRRALALAALLVGAAGCELDKVGVPSGSTTLVVHSVLDPFEPEYVVLVEETLTGRVGVAESVRDSLDPIASSGGIPVRDAIVTITSLAGQTAVGVEDASIRADRRGKGVYRFLNREKPFLPPPCPNCLSVNQGDGYTLTVTTRGLTVTGRTTVPRTIRGNPSVLGRPVFNRDHDSVTVQTSALAGESRLLLRVGSPYGPFSLFTDSATFTAPGSLRNPFAEGFPPAFVPGFRQSVVLLGVDQNFFDYFRTANSPFTGSGLISHLTGGTGVFGSILRLATTRLDVTADFRDPIDGRYVGGVTGGDTLELWAGETVRDGRLVTGDLRTLLGNSLGTARAGVLGSLDNGRLTLRVLRGDVVNDVAFTLTGSAPAAGPAATLTLTRSDGGATLTFRRVSP